MSGKPGVSALEDSCCLPPFMFFVRGPEFHHILVILKTTRNGEGSREGNSRQPFRAGTIQGGKEKKERFLLNSTRRLQRAV